MTSIDAPKPWVQNRFLAALLVTCCIMAVLAIVYILYARRSRLAEILQSARMLKVFNVFRFVLGGSAIVALLASFFPRENPEAGILLYFILWPLLGLQFAAACLPWEKLVQKAPVVTSIATVMIGFYAFAVVSLMLRLTSYI